jgi:NAD(P)-dependent dehydrogenase (short-subunit alcohol dehydrogenase family)
MQRLKGKVAVVTGASRGGGRGIALVLGEEGATVYVTGRSVRGALTSMAGKFHRSGSRTSTCWTESSAPTR